MKEAPQAVPATVHRSAGTTHVERSETVQGFQVTTQSPSPSDTVVTVRGASGPRAPVRKNTGAEAVDPPLRYAVTVTL